MSLDSKEEDRASTSPGESFREFKGRFKNATVMLAAGTIRLPRVSGLKQQLISLKFTVGIPTGSNASRSQALLSCSFSSTQAAQVAVSSASKREQHLEYLSQEGFMCQV